MLHRIYPSNLPSNKKDRFSLPPLLGLPVCSNILSFSPSISIRSLQQRRRRATRNSLSQIQISTSHYEIQST